MGWIDDLLGTVVALAGVIVNPRRKILNFSSAFTVADNPTTGMTDVDVAGGGGGSFTYPPDQRFVVSVTGVGALRAVPSADFIDGMIAHRLGTLYAWEWDSSSSATDDGLNAVKPDDVSGNGRWMKVVLASLQDLFGTGDHDNELVAWDAGSNAWLPVADGVLSAAILSPPSTLTDNIYIADKALGKRIGVGDEGAGVACYVDGVHSQAYLALHDVSDVLKRVVGAIYDSALVKLFFFDGAPGAAKQSVSGTTASGKADSLITALAAYGLITNASTAGNGDDPTDTRTFTSTNATSNLVHHYSLPNDAITRVVVFVASRDTGTNMYVASFSRKFKTVSGGATLLDDGAATLVKDEITVTGATVVASTDGFDVSYGGSGAVRTAGFIKVYMYSDTLGAAT